jgi:hypothetical protein
MRPTPRPATGCGESKWASEVVLKVLYMTQANSPTTRPMQNGANPLLTHCTSTPALKMIKASIKAGRRPLKSPM